MHRPSARFRTPWLPVAAALLLTLAACGSSALPPTPTPTAQPTPTPVTATVATPADAASIVIASNPMFAGAIELTPDIVGASKYWEAQPLEGGGYRVVLTVGWGDCPAGCIEKHIWTFDVQPDGQLSLVSETGDEVPTDLPG